MLVIIPHKDDALKIIKFQKELKELFSNKGLNFYFKPPLWFYLPEKLNNEAIRSKAELKNIKISSIIMEEVFFQDNQIISNISADINGEKISFPYTHLYEYKKGSSDSELVKEVLADVHQKKILNYPMEFRIFRLGIAEKLSQNSSAISDFIWVKLR